jgi:xylulokinase
MLLGLDLGTTNVKGLVTDRAGRVLGQASVPIGLQYAGECGVEQDIQEIEEAALSVMRQIGGSVNPAGIEAIGVSSQGGALQMADTHGQPIGPVISWLDQRGRSFDRALTNELGKDWFVQRLHRGCAGVAIGQLMRLRKESPALLAPPNRVGFVGDTIVSRLCGRAAHDGTSCSLTVLYNPELQAYDPDVLQRLELDSNQLPDLLAASEAAGGLRSQAAQLTGLRPGIPVSAAVHDQYASALGSGAVQAGKVMVGAGTAWVLLAVSDRLAPPVIDQAFVCNHVVKGLFGQILSLVNGGSSWTWALNLLGLSGKESEEIETLLASTRPGSAGARFWPFLVPVDGPGLASGTKGRLSGLELAHWPADILRAVLEGLAFELNRYLGFLRQGGWPIASLVIGGGAAASRVTTQLLADVTGLPLACQGTGEASLLGAAIIARGLLEPKASLAELSVEMAMPALRVEPGAGCSVYRELFEQYVRSLPMSQRNSS